MHGKSFLWLEHRDVDSALVERERCCGIIGRRLRLERGEVFFGCGIGCIFERGRVGWVIVRRGFRSGDWERG